MSWYVKFSLNGRSDKLKFSNFLEERGYSDEIFYHQGGWDDYDMRSYMPHLKFDKHDDAVAFVLAFGGECSTEPPKMELKSKTNTGD